MGRREARWYRWRQVGWSFGQRGTKWEDKQKVLEKADILGWCLRNICQVSWEIPMLCFVVLSISTYLGFFYRHFRYYNVPKAGLNPSVCCLISSWSKREGNCLKITGQLTGKRWLSTSLLLTVEIPTARVFISIFIWVVTKDRSFLMTG